MSLWKPTDHALTQGARYFIVGGVAFVADIFCIWALTEVGQVYYLASAAIAFLVGLCVNYTLSITWVFASRRFENQAKEFLLFSLIGVFSAAVGLLLIWVFTEFAHIHYLVSKLIATAVVFSLNFSIRKSFLFTDSQPAAQANDFPTCATQVAHVLTEKESQ